MELELEKLRKKYSLGQGRERRKRKGRKVRKNKGKDTKLMCTGDHAPAPCASVQEASSAHYNVSQREKGINKAQICRELSQKE